MFCGRLNSKVTAQGDLLLEAHGLLLARSYALPRCGVHHGHHMI